MTQIFVALIVVGMLASWAGRSNAKAAGRRQKGTSWGLVEYNNFDIGGEWLIAKIGNMPVEYSNLGGKMRLWKIGDLQVEYGVITGFDQWIIAAIGDLPVIYGAGDVGGVMRIETIGDMPVEYDEFDIGGEYRIAYVGKR